MDCECRRKKTTLSFYEQFSLLTSETFTDSCTFVKHIPFWWDAYLVRRCWRCESQRKTWRMGISTRERENELETGVAWMCTTTASVLTRVRAQHSMACSHLPLSSSSKWMLMTSPSGSAIPLAHPGVTDTQADQVAPVHLLGAAPFSRFLQRLIFGRERP